MQSFLSRFRVSMLEMFLFVSGIGLGLGLLLEANDVLLVFVRSLVAFMLLGTFAVAMSAPSCRQTLLSFVGGVLIFLAYDFMSTKDRSNYSMHSSLHRAVFAFFYEEVLGTLPHGPLERAGERMATLELSLIVGVLCAWVTRSLRADESKGS